MPARLSSFSAILLLEVEDVIYAKLFLARIEGFVNCLLAFGRINASEFLDLE
jgi:hypothetical protein